MDLYPIRSASRAPGPRWPNEPVPEPFVKEDEWRLVSPEPSTPPKEAATPRHPGITVDHITPKHPEFDQKLDNAMTSRYHSTPIPTFQTLLPGPNLKAKQLKSLGCFKDLVVERELDMYPHLVCSRAV